MNRSWGKNSRSLHSASSRCSLRPESSRKHLIVRIAGVLRLRAVSHSLCDRSARRFAQDDNGEGALPSGDWLLVKRTADPSASLGGCDFLRLRPESSEQHPPMVIAEVLRLRAINPSLCDRSARRFAPTARRGRQDDGFVWGGRLLAVIALPTRKKAFAGCGGEQRKGASPHLVQPM